MSSWPNTNQNKDFWSSPAAVIIFLTLTILLGSGAFRISSRYFEIRRERQALEKKISDLNAEKRRLEEASFFAESPETIERMAKEKLNLKNPKEEVVIVTPPESAAVSGSDNASAITRFFIWFKNLVLPR